MNLEIIPVTRSVTVTITRLQCRGLCDALRDALNCKEQLLLINTQGSKRTRNACDSAIELLKQIERHLRDATGD
ncbi:hypothetical protein [Erwinia rhapontici]|uniref:hypothetical protein n=1 Tax=Erwinia rhapontici TaxID=55212 RepID=UPI00105EBDCC|nr:hypothetical protein [Erwinia rhapontici]TDS98328.1 hypothetical protein EDF84_10615 [Erwinia rhapontici]